MMAGRALLVVAVLGLGAIGIAMPDSILVGGTAWLAFLLACLAGWGHLAARIARVDDSTVDIGLRAVWGIGAFLAVAGVLLALGLCSRGFLLGLAAIGAAGFAWRELTTTVPSSERIRQAWRKAREQPALALLVSLIALLAVFQIVAAVASLDRNPWDDDIAYTPLVKRVLDCGDLIEPFSFRRLGAYGGQTLLQALAASRGNLASVHLLDRGLCQALVLLLVVGHAIEQRRVQGLWLGVVVLALLFLPDNSINTASYWSGFAMFLGLYRTIARLESADTTDGAPERVFALASLVGAATCTLRQNYIAVVGLFLLIVLVRGRYGRRALLVTAAVAAAVLVPYAIAAFRASHTFLFPFWTGTWNDAIALRPAVASWIERVSYVVLVCVDTAPLVLIPVFAVLLAFTRDERRARPLTSLFAACALGFLVLALSFLGTDSFHLWRYAFGFAAALFVVFALEIGSTDDTPPVRLPVLGRWAVLAALVLQIAIGRDALVKRYVGMASDLREAASLEGGDPNAEAERHRYASLQGAVPAGAPFAVMVDDPAFLDFGRNPIANLDTPGFASPAPGLPAFTEPETVRAYFRSLGFRYVAFVRSDASRYFYRRGFWLWRLFNDSEMFQAMSAYAIDMIDTFAALAKRTTVRDEDGLVLLDLGTDQPALPPHGDEAELRDVFVHKLAIAENLTDAWSLSTRGMVRFEDGFSSLQFIDPHAPPDPTWTGPARPAAEPLQRGQAVKWLYRRSHLRLRGMGDMHLILRGRVNVVGMYTRPRLDVSFDGALLTSVRVDETGQFVVDMTVAASEGWHEMYLVWSSISQPERDAKDLRAARLDEVTWERR